VSLTTEVSVNCGGPSASPLASEIDAESNLALSDTVKSEQSVFVFSATSAQRRFWLLDQLHPEGNPALNMSLGLRWRGPLDLPALRRALNGVVARHEALRTTFQSERGQLRQLITPSLELDVPTLELSDFRERNATNVFFEVRRDEAQRPFDLRIGPLVRTRLLRRAPREHLLLLTLHHIISEGWSNGILVRDLCTLYAAFMQGKQSPLCELTIQFADYADWQQERLAHDGFAAQRDYWHEKLAGDLPALDLPFDRPQRATPNLSGGLRSRVLAPQLVRAAKSLAAGESASPFMIFFAAFQALLHRYTSQVDFLVTSPNANRERQEFESLVGPFVNPLLLRVDLHGNPTFLELLSRVRGTTLEAFSNQDIPFESLLDEFRAARLQVNFQYESGLQQPTNLPEGLTLEVLPLMSGGTLYELSASLLEEVGNLRLELEYNRALFDAPTIDRMLDRYETLLEVVVTDPTTRISALPLYTRKNLPEHGRSDGVTFFSSPEVGRSAPTRAVGESVRPYLGLHHQLIAIWEELLSVRDIGIRDNFFDLGGNSLLAMRMLQRIELTCGKVILPAALFTNPTIEHLAGEIAREVIDESASLLRVNDAGTRTPFFYLHGDLFGAGFYTLKLSRELGADQPFYVLPPPDIRTLPTAPSIEEMAAAHLQALRAVCPTGPYIIGGFCLGGLVAYELAQQIKTSGDTVEMLLIIDAAPEDRPLRALQRLAKALGTLLRWDNHTQVAHFGRWAVWRARLARWYELDAQAQTRTAIRRIRNRSIYTYDLLRRRLRFLRKSIDSSGTGAATVRELDVPSAFLWASASYHPQPYGSPVALLLSDDLFRDSRDLSRDWRQLAPDLNVQLLKGAHLECITAHIETLAETIEGCLQRIASSQHHQH